MSQIKLIILVTVVGYVGATYQNTYDILRQIWKYQRAFSTCDSTLNYGCRCTEASAKDLTCDFKCISLDRRCDGRMDCPLGDDEKDCPAGRFEKGSVCCTNGTSAQLCDGIAECALNADEALCEPPVPTQCPGRMQCPNGNCATVCDGDLDCEDEVGCDLDEKDCRNICPAGDLVCGSDGTCGEICNGISQCEDGSDESTCYYECAADEISCEFENSHTRGCVELCEDPSGACENDVDFTDAYCASCLDCGVPISCEKGDEHC